MMRQMLDDYLDGGLTKAQRDELEVRLAGDPAAASLLAKVKQERALRYAALASFEPTTAEAETIAARTLAALDGAAPVGYVGVWVRRGAAVAAVLALVVGSFALGRTTAGTGGGGVSVAKAEPQVIYRVMYYADTGELQEREFASVDEANDFMTKVDVRHGEPQVAAVDLSHPGSF